MPGMLQDGLNPFVNQGTKIQNIKRTNQNPLALICDNTRAQDRQFKSLEFAIEEKLLSV